MDANDDVIGLLNDIGAGKVKDEIFMDRNGEPTDLFLEALKSEFPRSGPASATNPGIHGEKSIDSEINKYSLPKQPVTSATMKRKEKDDRTTHSKSVMKGPKLSKNCSGPSSGKQRKNSTSKQVATREQIRETVKLVVNRKPAIEEE